MHTYTFETIKIYGMQDNNLYIFCSTEARDQRKYRIAGISGIYFEDINFRGMTVRKVFTFVE